MSPGIVAGKKSQTILWQECGKNESWACRWEGGPHQAANERLHGLVQGAAQKDGPGQP
jgi:hypothetical protein